MLEMVFHTDGCFGVRRLEALDEDFQGPFAGTRIGLDPRRVEDFGCEVAAEEAPGGAVDGGVDVVLITAENLIGGEGWWAVGKDGTVLDQGLVGKGTIPNEDSWAAADMEGDDGTVLVMEVSEDGLEFGKRFAEPEDVADDGKGEGSWREFSGESEFRRGKKVENDFEEDRDAKGDEDEKIPCFHHEVSVSHSQWQWQ